MPTEVVSFRRAQESGLKLAAAGRRLADSGLFARELEERMVHGDASKMDAPISPWAGGSHVWVEEDHDVSPVGRGVVRARAALEDVRAERFVDASLGFGGAVPVEEGRPLFGVLVDHGVAVAVSHVGETGRDDFEGEVGPASAQTSTRRRRGGEGPRFLSRAGEDAGTRWTGRRPRRSRW